MKGKSEIERQHVGTGRVIRPSNPFSEFRREDIEQSIPARFSQSVALAPDAVAVSMQDGSLTYSELDRLSNRIAHGILEVSGVDAEPVSILLDQGATAVATILGVLKAGKFYVPLEPSQPLTRNASMIEESGTRLIVTVGEYWQMANQLGSHLKVVDLDCLDGKFSFDSPRIPLGPDNLAYIFYTSGSTGRAKGVFDNHRNVLHNVLRYTNTLHFAASDRLTLLQSCSFSGTVSSLFGALLNGATICPFNVQTAGPADLAEWVNRQKITIYHSVPALFRSFLEGDRFFPNVRLIRLEGDQASKLDFELFRRYFSPDCILVNGLGTTETGIASQYFMGRESVIETANLPVGHPTPGVNLLLLDDDGKPIRSGHVGEIGVESDFLALGYWRNPELTKRAFQSPSLCGGGRLYRTGDRAEFRSDGTFEYLGRNDFRVKIRGQTVEAAEVESALAELSTVKNALVVAREDPRRELRLVAYIILAEGAHPTVTQIRQALLNVLPGFIVPSHYVFLEEYPLSSNKKVVRQALPEPDWLGAHANRPQVSPRSALEIQLVQLWKETLDIRSISVTDDFFELGGHSLLAARMLEKVEVMFGKRIPPTVLLGGATVDHLARALMSDSDDLHMPFVEIHQGSGPPFFFLHGDYNSGGFYCLNLSRFLNADEPFCALPPQHYDLSSFPRTFEAMSASHIDTLRRLQPEGPYFLGGVCNGGHVAFEIARSLEASGQQVALLVIIRATAKNVRYMGMWRVLRSLGNLLGRDGEWQREWFQRWQSFVQNYESRPKQERPAFLLERFRKLAGRLGSSLLKSSIQATALPLDPPHKLSSTQDSSRTDLYGAYRYLEDTFIPKMYPGRITLFWPKEDEESPEEAAHCWSKFARDIDLHVLPGDHVECITKYASILARKLQACLMKARDDLYAAKQSRQ